MLEINLKFSLAESSHSLNLTFNQAAKVSFESKSSLALRKWCTLFFIFHATADILKNMLQL
jgi:hypothetical protein